MILTRSPYYKNVTWRRPSDNAVCDSFTLNIYIYEGAITAAPTTATYSITKENIQNLTTGDTKIDIARLVDDFIDPQLITQTDTGLYQSKATVWVKTEVVYDVSGDTSTELIETDYAIRGYGKGSEGENYQLDKPILSDVSEVDAYKESIVMLPIEKVNDFSSRPTEIPDITILSYPNGTLSTTIDATGSSDNDDIVSILVVNANDATGEEYIDITYAGDTFTIYLRDEYRFNPIDVQFSNRYGSSQTLTFFKERKDSTSVDGSQYERSFGQPIDGVHQFQKYNVNGRSKFTAQTGFIYEESNELVRQLLMSENVWVDGLPVNVTTNDIQLQNSKNDKLVNYLIDFEYSFNEIHTV
tara:strand:- start:17669 stop:18736 length:1068 start_codon:yes stop_codon:yes gene_type:complete